MPDTMKHTYRLSWEIIQEFRLPADHSCCSVDVNEVLGEIMFACRHKGLLHYKWSSHTGLVLATKQPYRVTNYACNCRLVTCCSDGSYLLLNHRQLRYVRLASHRVQHPQQLLQSQTDGCASTNLTGSLYAPESLTAYSRTVGMDYVEYLEQAVSIGDVRSMAADKQADSVFLLYSDRLVRNSLSNLADSFVFDRCFSLTSELFNVRLSRQFVYLMNSMGDIMLRYRSECYDKRDQLFWRTIGSRAFASSALMEAQVNLNRRLCRNSGHYLQLLDSESPVGILGLTVDPCRQIAFASTGGSSLYAVWHPDREPDLSPDAWDKNWLEDAHISLLQARGGRVCRDDNVAGLASAAAAACASGTADNTGYSSIDAGYGLDRLETAASDRFQSEVSDTMAFEAFVPGPLASFSSTAGRSGFLYVVDAISGDKVSVLKYSTETARIG